MKVTSNLKILNAVSEDYAKKGATEMANSLSAITRELEKQAELTTAANKARMREINWRETINIGQLEAEIAYLEAKLAEPLPMLKFGSLDRDNLLVKLIQLREKLTLEKGKIDDIFGEITEAQLVDIQATEKTLAAAFEEDLKTLQISNKLGVGIDLFIANPDLFAGAVQQQLQSIMSRQTYVSIELDGQNRGFTTSLLEEYNTLNDIRTSKEKEILELGKANEVTLIKEEATLSKIKALTEAIALVLPAMGITSADLTSAIGGGEKQDAKQDTIETRLGSYAEDLEKQVNASFDALKSARVKSIEKLLTDTKVLADELESIAVAGGNVGDKLFDIFDKTYALKSILEATTAGELYLEEQKVLLDAASVSIENYKDEIEDTNNTLNGWEEKLKGVNDAIKTLSKPLFVGQSETERMMADYDQFLKEQNLSAIGITNAQEFLASAVKMSNSELQEMLKTFKDINDETSTGKNSYDAWRETVEEFIRATVKSGNELGTNVTGAIKKYQTLLLSTSKFSDSSETTESGLSVLKDAYDVYYGGMTNSVESAIAAKEREGQETYATAGDVIRALQAQWLAQDTYSRKIDNTTTALDLLNQDLEDSQSSYDIYNENIKTTTSYLNTMITTANKAVAALSLANNNRNDDITYGSSTGLGNWTPPVDQSISTSTSKTSSNDRGFPLPAVTGDWKTRAFSKGGLVTKPTIALIGEKGPEVVIPMSEIVNKGFNMKSDDLLSSGREVSISIGNVNISGVNTDNPADFAQRFAQELKRELKTL